MKITDLSIESNNIGITALSKQKAHKVVGGSNFYTTGVPGGGATHNYVTAIYSGVPGGGATPDYSYYDIILWSYSYSSSRSSSTSSASVN